MFHESCIFTLPCGNLDHSIALGKLCNGLAYNKGRVKLHQNVWQEPVINGIKIFK
jgi:hypothetical protein